MKTLGKIAVSGITGTVLMTLYAYQRSRAENEKYLQPELLNALIDRAKALPEIKNEKSHPAGWLLHFGTGISFVSVYRFLFRHILFNPDLRTLLITGGVSGVTGILIWSLFFKGHPDPPENDRYGYYRQLFWGHIIFSAGAMATYRMLSRKGF